MKRIFTFFIFGILAFITQVSFAQDTIVGWKFPSTSADSLADLSAGTLNTSRYISCQYGTYGTASYHAITVDYTTNGSLGSPDKSAKTVGWDNGVDSTYWMVKFKTTGYGSMKLYSKQQAGGNYPGPRDFKVQYKLPGSSSPWIDLTTVICANDWTTGVVNGVDLPATCNNQSSQISIRWKMSSNTDINGGTVAATGISKIDDIIVTGTLLAGIELNENSNNIVIYPNPNAGSFSIETNGNMKNISIFNVIGKCVYESKSLLEDKINLSGFSSGIYFIKITDFDNDQYTNKVIVE